MTNQQLIKAVNKKHIYQLISENVGISRVKISNITKLSKTTVSSLVDELIQDGHIIDKGASESFQQGRKPNSLEVNFSKDCIIVISSKKAKLEIAIVNTGYEIEKFEEFDLNLESDFDDFLIEIIKSETDKYKKDKNILGICLVIPGIIDEKKKKVVSMVVNLDKYGNFIENLREKIAYEYPIAIFNDTACLAYAENSFGDIDVDNYIYLNINEGVGASLVENSSILRGATGLGTQFGHFSIDKNGIQCSCGNRGCLENYIGEIGLQNRISYYDILPPENKKVSFRYIYELAQNNDKRALKLINDLSDELSYALGNLITMFHTETVIIGGSGTKLGEIYLENIKEKLKNIGFRQFVEDVDLHYTKLGEEYIFIGAAKYYIDTHYNFINDMYGNLFLY